MNTSLLVRSAAQSDIPVILTFVRELAEYEREPDAVVATEEGLERALFGPRPYAEALIADVDGEAVGFALFFHTFSTWVGRPGVYLEDLYVRPSMRGKGIGKGLLMRLVEIAHERDCGRVEWAVLTWNQPAIDFYLSLGAQPMEEWRVYRLDQGAIDLLDPPS